MTRAASAKPYRFPLITLLLAFVAARIFCFTWGRLRFDATPLDYYFQFVDPVLLKERLFESVTHLHSQPPLFNFLLGIVLKLFPVHYGAALHVIFVLCGLVMTLAIFQLMVRMGVNGWLAALVTIHFACSPITVLYENWLYLTYPVAALLAVSALLLHRYLMGGKLSDAVAFFLILAAIVLTRGYFNLVWFLVAVGALLLAMPEARKRTLIAAAIPLPVLLGVCVLTYVHFGTLTTGKIYQDFNLAQMSTQRLPRSVREQLIKRRTISRINRLPIYGGTVEQYAPYIKVPKPTEIAVLDQRVKSTGHANWHAKIFLPIAAQYGRDARVVIGLYPSVYWNEVRKHVWDFTLPADQSDPFLNIARPGGAGRPAKYDRMAPLVRGADLILAGQMRHEGVAWVHVIGFPALILFVLFRFGRWFFTRNSSRFGGDERAPARAAVIVAMFILYNFCYIAAVTILFSSDDHSRYRFESTPLMCVLVGMLAWKALGMFTRGGEDNRVNF